MGTFKCPVLVEDNSIANSANSACVIIPEPSTCGATLRQSVAVINTPDRFFVSYTHSPTKKYTPSLDNGYVMEINNCTYQISGIVYLKSCHYWCEIYSTQKNCKNGWFVHNGLWNNGKATFVGLKSLKTFVVLTFFSLIPTQITFKLYSFFIKYFNSVVRPGFF